MTHLHCTRHLEIEVTVKVLSFRTTQPQVSFSDPFNFSWANLFTAFVVTPTGDFRIHIVGEFHDYQDRSGEIILAHLLA